MTSNLEGRTGQGEVTCVKNWPEQEDSYFYKYQFGRNVSSVTGFSRSGSTEVDTLD